MYCYNLPFEPIHESRTNKSVLVRFPDGEQAFISTANLLVLMREPSTPYRIIESPATDSKPSTRWVMLAKISWELGFKKTMFDECGNPIR